MHHSHYQFLQPVDGAISAKPRSLSMRPCNRGEGGAQWRGEGFERGTRNLRLEAWQVLATILDLNYVRKFYCHEKCLDFWVIALNPGACLGTKIIQGLIQQEIFVHSQTSIGFHNHHPLNSEPNNCQRDWHNSVIQNLWLYKRYIKHALPWLCGSSKTHLNTFSWVSTSRRVCVCRHENAEESR